MMYIIRKLEPVKLPIQEYALLCQRVLKRDGFKCRRCTNRNTLQIHHIIKRSMKRLDTDWNLITVCLRCHDLIEQNKLEISQNDSHIIDANEPVNFTLTTLKYSGTL